ncbi:hypothetical protein Kisp01_24740 [Kineosporia sp. NBRC 101677]|nr:hypothetical protein Kisp01_24740 [Kineosporia sp. NBRC 101677]
MVSAVVLESVLSSAAEIVEIEAPELELTAEVVVASAAEAQPPRASAPARIIEAKDRDLR